MYGIYTYKTGWFIFRANIGTYHMDMGYSQPAQAPAQAPGLHSAFWGMVVNFVGLVLQANCPVPYLLHSWRFDSRSMYPGLAQKKTFCVGQSYGIAHTSR